MDIVKMKGTGDGVKMYLSAEASISDIVKALHSKLDEFRRFFGTGHCNIYFLGREFTKSDKLRLEAVAKAMLPESTINYGDRRIEKRAAVTPVKQELDAKEETMQEILEIQKAAAANFKSSRARFFEGSIGKGETLESDGHMTLIGNVEKGAKIIAVGNIVVLGRLSGTAEAGMMGNKEAYITALEFEPEKIKIANISMPYPEGEYKNIQTAKVINNEIFITEFLVK